MARASGARVSETRRLDVSSQWTFVIDSSSGKRSSIDIVAISGEPSVRTAGTFATCWRTEPVRSPTQAFTVAAVMVVPRRSEIWSGLVVQSSRFDVLVGNREIYKLSIVSGPFSKRIKGKVGCSYFMGDEQTGKQKGTLGESIQIFVPGTLNDTKKSARPTRIFLQMLGPNNLNN